jgi:hypothetical protein
VFFGLIFREKAKSKRSVTSWREHAKGVLPTPVQHGLGAAKTLSPHLRSWSSEKRKSVWFNDSLSHKKSNESNDGLNRDFSGMGFGRRAEKAAALKGFMLAKPVQSSPKHSPAVRPHSTGHSDETIVSLNSLCFRACPA